MKTGATVILAGMTLPKNYGGSYLRSFEDVFRDVARKYNLPLILWFSAVVRLGRTGQTATFT